MIEHCHWEKLRRSICQPPMLERTLIIWVQYLRAIEVRIRSFIVMRWRNASVVTIIFVSSTLYWGSGNIEISSILEIFQLVLLLLMLHQSGSCRHNLSSVVVFEAAKEIIFQRNFFGREKIIRTVTYDQVSNLIKDYSFIWNLFWEFLTIPMIVTNVLNGRTPSQSLSGSSSVGQATW